MNTHMKVPGFVDVGVIIGTHGATVKRLQEESGARINHNRDTGVFTVSKAVLHKEFWRISDFSRTSVLYPNTASLCQCFFFHMKGLRQSRRHVISDIYGTGYPPPLSRLPSSILRQFVTL